MNNIAVVTTFPTIAWDVYARSMLTSFTKHWPKETPLLVQLDDDFLIHDVKKILRESDGFSCGWEKDHADFVERNRQKDDKEDYRKQAARFCHKVFAVKRTLIAVKKAKEDGIKDCPRYLIWLDADVTTSRDVTLDDIKKCLPKEGDAVAYLGRKDWPHSECGWLAFDLDNGGAEIIDRMVKAYVSDVVLSYEQWHDSWVFDQIMKNNPEYKGTNLTPSAKGIDVWPQSPMASFSVHHKGPVAKQTLAMGPKESAIHMANGGRPIVIQTRNSVPNESIKNNILENQALIKNWITDCLPTDEEIVVVSAGPQLIPEDVRAENLAGRKVIAVKHALQPLLDAGVDVWGCILLDPRPHVNEFVKNPSRDVLWFVASQVVPSVTQTLLDAGCTVWGYHAAVGANEEAYTARQPTSVISGGSATATRGLFLLNKLGFKKFRMYGYDLCVPDKPDLSLKDDVGQSKYHEVTIEAKHTHFCQKRSFWSTGELLAQYQELIEIIGKLPWEIRAFGGGIASFLTNAKNINDLRRKEKNIKLGFDKPVGYGDLLKWKTRSSMKLPSEHLKAHRKPKKAKNS